MELYPMENHQTGKSHVCSSRHSVCCGASEVTVSSSEGMDIIEPAWHEGCYNSIQSNHVCVCVHLCLDIISQGVL